MPPVFTNWYTLSCERSLSFHGNNCTFRVWVLSGGFTPCRHLRHLSQNLFSAVMMITWRMKLAGNLPPGHDALLFDEWHGIFYMPSRTDTARHTKAFVYPVMDHWGNVKVLRNKVVSNRRPVGPQSNTPTTRLRRLPQLGRSIIPRVLNVGGGDLFTLRKRICFTLSCILGTESGFVEVLKLRIEVLKYSIVTLYMAERSTIVDTTEVQ